MSLSDKYSLPITAHYNSTQIPSDFHSHTEYEIYYFHSGRCNYLIGDRIYALMPGDLILMHGMTLHYPKIDTQSEYCRSILHFDPAFAAELFRSPVPLHVLRPFEERRNVRIPLNAEDRHTVEPLLDKLVRLYRQEDDLSYHKFLAAFQNLLLFIYERCSDPMEDRSDGGRVKDQNAHRIISYIEENYKQDLTLDGLSASLRLSKFYLVKMFKEVTGTTIFAYLYQRRINQAKVLFLLEPGKPVTEAAYEVGFKHPSHFSQMFKKLEGYTPEAYRRRIIERENKA